MVSGIDHIAIAVNSLEEAIPFYRDQLGLPLKTIEEVPDQKVKVAIFTLGPSRIELLEPTAEDSPISKFLAKRGPGLHHLALRSDAVADDLHRLDQGGTRLIDSSPRSGADGMQIAFVHPEATAGVLLELTQPASHVD
ncbi:MAG: methylmalonyl-CoA epimerase [Candidatus Eremiobacteraeota bacterium]|nr:methylmalonyl-CoA epimerase [Candidatus Eremiobacteraeota bacterium]